MEETYEGTPVVKNAKLYILKDKYTSFKMKDDESILEMFYRLQVIVNDLKSLGGKVKDKDSSHQFLRCLPPRFDTLVSILVRDGLEKMTPSQVLGDVVTQTHTVWNRMGASRKKRKTRRRRVWNSRTAHHLRGRASQRKKSQVMMRMLVTLMMKPWLSL